MRSRAGWMLLLVLGAGACADADEAPAPVPADAGVPAVEESAAAVEAATPPDAVEVTLREWAVELTADSVPAGAVTFAVRNAGTVPHALEVEGNDQEWETPVLEAGATLTMTVNLTPGEYQVYCPVDTAGVDHEDRGMTTRLRVY